MADKSGIDWCDSTWDPCLGCTKASPGCDNCWALKACWRLAHNPVLGKSQWAFQAVVRRGDDGTPKWTGAMTLIAERLDWPKRWKATRWIFVGSKCDVFHQSRPYQQIKSILNAAFSASHHIYLWLTKRPELMKWAMERWLLDNHLDRLPLNWMPMVTAEDQERADERIPVLLSIPAHHYGVSIEPMLEEVDLADLIVSRMGDVLQHINALYSPPQPIGERWCSHDTALDAGMPEMEGQLLEVEWGPSSPALDWVICGGESGPEARPTNPDWVRRVRDQCYLFGVPFFFKQWGEWVGVSMVEGPGAHYSFPDGRTVRRVGKKQAGHLIDGREWHQRPAILTGG